MLVLSPTAGGPGEQLTLLTPQGELGASAQDVAIGGGRALPALDNDDFLVWDFQKLFLGLDPTLGAINQNYASTGTQQGPGSSLDHGFVNSGGGGAAVLGPGSAGLVFADQFYALGSASGGTGTANNPPTVPDNTSLTVQSFIYVSSLTSTTQGVIASKAFGPTWVAPFNAVETNLTTANDGSIEYGMVDSAAPGAEIGATVTGRGALTVGYNHVALVIDQTLKRAFLYTQGIQRGFFAFTGGLASGTGPWMLGGNIINTSDSSNLIYSRVQISRVARSATYLAAAAAGWLRS